MKIQSSTSYLGSIKENELKCLPSDLFLDEAKKKKGKAKFEIRSENGYIRHYIIKANGEKILVKEVKQQQETLSATGTGELSASLDKMLMEQLTSKQPTNQQNNVVNEDSNEQKEARINKYKASI
ncbi:hypothetical protein AEA09_12230 [Lysinibacillus contaminans]|uniref:Uncharacterized protein n=1 Tax=Lysinibacillus contaminans TaxID=1293441 RepID=A0ABR5K2U2_9BACI|nr:hypothetical protein [Lysinibacillus contaminans]KOS69243.1 hypothetical protein AEA09_12230 [Lysinibacillus contaminans]